VLVTDGLRVNGSVVTKIFPSPAPRYADLVDRMLHAGWGAGALTLRTQRIDFSAFDPAFRHMEWTLTALLLARSYRVGFLDEPTYRYYEANAGSLSKNPAHKLAAPAVWRRLLKTYEGTRYESTVRRRYGSLCHSTSWECVLQGKLGQAWRLHFESVKFPGGLAYVAYSVRLAMVTLHGLLIKRNGSAAN